MAHSAFDLNSLAYWNIDLLITLYYLVIVFHEEHATQEWSNHNSVV